MSRRRRHEQRLESIVDRATRKFGHMEMKIDFTLLLTLITQIGLALRHPHNIGDSATYTRKIVEIWIMKLADGNEQDEAYLLDMINGIMR